MIRNCIMAKNSPRLLRLISTGIEIRMGFQKFQRSAICRTSCYNCNEFSTVAIQLGDDGTKVSLPGKKKRAKKVSTTGNKTIIKSDVLPASVQSILDYVKQHCGTRSQHITSSIPRQFLKSTSTTPTTVYLIDEKEAKNISTLIKSENPDKKSPVVELHPGIGLLTWELLNTIGFKYITCLEDTAPLGENLASNFNVSVIDCSVNDLPRYHHLDKHDGGDRINSILTSIATDKDFGSQETTNSRKQLYIIGALPCISAMNFLIRCYATKRVYFEEDLPWSGVTFFVALGGKSAHICRATPDDGLVAYRATSVLFQTFFTCKELGTVPREAFIPWRTVDKDFCMGLNRKKRKLKVDDSNLKFMRIDVNKQAEEMIGKDNLFLYWYFVRQNLYARTNRVIPELERWIPGCGIQLIKQGYTIYSQFGSLKPDQIFKLYLYFVSLPEFANSSFLNAVEKYQVRLELSEEDETENK